MSLEQEIHELYTIEDGYDLHRYLTFLQSPFHEFLVVDIVVGDNNYESCLFFRLFSSVAFTLTEIVLLVHCEMMFSAMIFSRSHSSAASRDEKSLVGTAGLLILI